MKKIVSLVSILLLGLTMSALAADTPNLIYHPFFVTTYPNPAIPGEPVRLDVVLQNMGSQTLYNVSTHILPAYPFVGIKTSGFIPRLEPGGSATVVYYLNVSKSAEPGQYTLTHEISYYYGEWNTNVDKYYYFLVNTSRTIGINVANKERIQLSHLDYSTQLLAGETGYVRAIIKNTGNVPVNNIVVRLVPTSPLLVPLAPDVQYIDTLSPGETKVVNFTFKSGPAVPSNTYSMNLMVKYGQVSYSTPLSVSIMGYPGIKVTNITFDKQLEPGKEAIISICMINLGAKLKDIYASLTPTEVYKIQSQVLGTNNNMEGSDSIVVLGSATKFIEDFPTNREICLNYTLAASQDAKTGPTTLYLSLNGGNIQANKIPIGVYIRGVPQLTISDLDFSQNEIYTNTPVEMSIQLENSGTGKAENVKVLCNNETAYLGSIDPDDASTASINLEFNKAGNHKVKVVAQYKDRQGKEYSQTFYINVIVSKKPMDYATIIEAIIVIIVIAVIVYKVKRR